ncbi:hypothetical protein [Massilia scottii]|uniref:hypothetical protein n=1 Tax=Massilia scottii TaxID=3057166 RepID=UPI0027968C46|nr:hypothetical protein [Massilia sp. CCM 9029]MDQ1829562.1 hypothetical protein [Massilia sp. CCM 9029]
MRQPSQPAGRIASTAPAVASALRRPRLAGRSSSASARAGGKPPNWFISASARSHARPCAGLRLRHCAQAA